jgi:hypothetical protein
MILYRLQEIELKALLVRLSNFEASGQGKIYNIEVMTNNDFPNDVFISYELSDTLSSAPIVKPNLFKITKEGAMENFLDMFFNPFEKYAFLGRCLVQNIENIEVIDN